METPDPTQSFYTLYQRFLYQSQFHGGRASPHKCHQKYFKCSIDWEGQNYISSTLDWKYTKKYVDISMPRYIPISLHRFHHKPPARPQDAPHPWNKPVYGKHIQLATQKRSAPEINSTDTNRVQPINGTFIYYAWSVDPTMIPALNEISTFQYTPTQHTMDKCNQVLDERFQS